MAFRTQDFQCGEHGQFEELLSIPNLAAVPDVMPCPTCGVEAPRIHTVGMVNPKFVYAKHDTARRASIW